jgi:hypothetical protein
MNKLLKLSIALSLSATLSVAATAHASISQKAIDRLCSDSLATFSSGESRYGTSRSELNKLKKMPVCNGVSLDDIKNNLSKRHPR